jgi:hypothetical protein
MFKINASQAPDLPAHIYEKIGNFTAFTACCAISSFNAYTFHNLGHGLTLKYGIEKPKKISIWDILYGKVSFKQSQMTSGDTIKYFLAGPLAQFAFSYGYLKLMQRANPNSALVLGMKTGNYLGIISSLLALVPTKIGKRQTDGYHILEMKILERFAHIGHAFNV